MIGRRSIGRRTSAWIRASMRSVVVARAQSASCARRQSRASSAAALVGCRALVSSRKAALSQGPSCRHCRGPSRTNRVVPAALQQVVTLVAPALRSRALWSPNGAAADDDRNRQRRRPQVASRADCVRATRYLCGMPDALRKQAACEKRDNQSSFSRMVRRVLVSLSAMGAFWDQKNCVADGV